MRLAKFTHVINARRHTGGIFVSRLVLKCPGGAFMQFAAFARGAGI